ncbi:hypothetical protein ZIOFF_053648 [Zingiber officinale]|uniref:Macro domain-containing protein n=1 Tax=Zingiber officinale TaxID=94328 RepID=A0A8J5KNQ2_ZINOF|nr:hypothetical protein ZIOFF_053648 [Zingiber officinale]
MEQVASDSAAARVGFSSSSAGGSVITFQFSPLSVLKIQKGDITEWSVDGSTDAIASVVKEDLFEIQTWYREEARLSHMTSEILPQCDRLEIVFGIIRLLISGAKHIEGIRISFNQFEQLNFLRVNAANEQMLGGGGVDGGKRINSVKDLYIELLAQNFLMRVARYQRSAEEYAAPQEKPESLRRAFQLPVSHVIHTVGPIYDVDEHPEVSLSNAYRQSQLPLAIDVCSKTCLITLNSIIFILHCRNSLKLAKENNIQYIAFPAISCGVYRYPSKEASRIAISVLKEFPDAFKEIHFVLFSDELYGVWLESASNDTGLQLLA